MKIKIEIVGEAAIVEIEKQSSPSEGMDGISGKSTTSGTVTGSTTHKNQVERAWSDGTGEIIALAGGHEWSYDPIQGWVDRGTWIKIPTTPRKGGIFSEVFGRPLNNVRTSFTNWQSLEPHLEVKTLKEPSEYAIYSHSTIGGLESCIRQHMANGWKCQGGVHHGQQEIKYSYTKEELSNVVGYAPSGMEERWSQAMVR